MESTTDTTDTTAAADDVCDVVDLAAAIGERTARGHQLVWIRPADDPALALIQSPEGARTLLRRTPLHVERGGSDATWHAGRAQMGYRDLIPDRWYGRFIASHIRVPTAGDVPDSVHHHGIRFQFLAVRRGRVKVVYEDQGDPFWMEPGDVVLQPPHIRHRVLATDGDFEIVEIGAPADHLTAMDPNLDLPNGVGDPARLWNGQRFVFDTPGGATTSWDCPGIVAEPTGIGSATDGLVHVERLRAGSTDSAPASREPLEFRFMFQMEGTSVLHLDGCPEPLRLGPADAVTIPPSFSVADLAIDDGWMLDVRVPHPHEQ